MLDNIMLILGAFFTAILAILAIVLNVANGIGPYIIAGLLLTFSGLSLWVCGRYWNVA